jgi:hypothetical protein
MFYFNWLDKQAIRVAPPSGSPSQEVQPSRFPSPRPIDAPEE